MHIRTLTVEDTDSLFQAVNNSFADYIVPFQLTEEQLQFKIMSENILLTWSVGVFNEGKIIAFIMHGVRKTNGKTVVYNAGTGVLPDFRGQGLVGKMYDFIQPFLDKNHVHKMILEVIEGNHAAIRAYEKNGFSIQRKLLCFNGTISGLNTSAVSIRPLENFSWDLLKSFWDIIPSWQSDIETINNIKPSALGAIDNGHLIGYVIFNPATKRIYQVAVHPGHRRKGIATALFSEINQQITCEKVQINNSDETGEHLTGLFETMGLINTINQFEMVKTM